MEYNKNRFQKTNDKKILHKVKKQWVVLSVALLAALGGGATVATTHASANANGANGQNNDQETTIKNRINQNLKMAQSQGANNNASQGQTKQVNVNSLSSDQITKQANMLHNQMLLGATQGTNPKTANGRQAARKNARVNRVNANTSAAASVANRKPAANANHSRMFGAAAPSANFGSMRLGGNEGTNGTDNQYTVGHPQLFSDAYHAMASDVRQNSNVDASNAYSDLMDLASASNMSSISAKGMNLGSDATNNQSSNNWIGDFNLAKSYVNTIKKNGNNTHVASLSNEMDSVSSLLSSSVNVGGSFSTSLNVTPDIQNSMNNSAKAAAINKLDQGMNKMLIDQVDSNYATKNNLNSHLKATVTLPNDQVDATITMPNSNVAISSLINNGVNNIQANVAADLNNASISVEASDFTIPKKGSQQTISTLESLGFTVTYTGNSDTYTLSKTDTKNFGRVSKPITPTINPLKNYNYNFNELADLVDGNNLDNVPKRDLYSIRYGRNGQPQVTIKRGMINKLINKAITSKITSIKHRSQIATNLRAIDQIMSDATTQSEYQHIIDDAKNLPNDNESSEYNAEEDIHSNAQALSATLSNVKGSNPDVVNQIKAYFNDGANYASNLANSLNNASASIASASNFASSASSQASTDANNAAVAADSKNNVSGSISSAKDQIAKDIAMISADSASYSSNADISYASNATSGNGFASTKLASNAAPNASYYAKDASAEISTANSLVTQARKDTSSDVHYDLPIHIVYKNADGTAQNKYDQYNNQFVPNSDNDTVHLISPSNSSVSITNGAQLYNSEDVYANHNLGSDTNYSLVGISDNGSFLANGTNSAMSIIANVNSAGVWHWGSNPANQSTPTFYYQAKAHAGKDINVQYINQNGYKVPAYAVPSASDGAHSLASGQSYSDDVNYPGANNYGDTINVINSLASSGHKPVTAANNDSGYYTYGFNNSDTNPSFSDYTFTNSEQTVTLPIHGDTISSNYDKLVINTAVRNHKGSFVSNATNSSAYTMSDLASMAGSYGPVHYGDLIKVDPQEFAPNGTDVTSSDYNVDPFATASDNSNQNVPFIYVSQNGPKWIDMENREDAVPNNLPNNNDPQTKVDVITNDNYNKAISYTTPAGYKGEPTFTDPSNLSHLTFNYLNGAHKGTVSPIHVTYKDQNGNVVSQGLITSKDVSYGDQINIPNGTDTTNPSDNSKLAGTGATLPSGYSIDYNRDGSDFDHYQINSDYNANSYKNYTNIGQANQSASDVSFGKNSDTQTNNISNNANKDFVGQDITLYVDGNYTSTNNKLYATVEHTDKNGTTTTLGRMPIYINGFNGDTRLVSPSDYLGQASARAYSNKQTKIIKSDGQNKTVSILDGDTITSSDTPYNVKFLNNKLVVTNKSGQPITISDTDNNNMIFDYRDPSNESNTHTVNIRYFYSDASDIPNKNTPTSRTYDGKPVIQLNKTDIITHTTGQNLDLTPYVANPPKGYQFVRVMSDSDSKNAFVNNKNSDFDNYSNYSDILHHKDNQIALTRDANDKTVDIKVIPTAGSITFHYYNQNGKPVKPDSDNEITGETAGKDFTNGANGYSIDNSNGNPSDTGDTAINTHTEFGNTPTQYTNDGKKYYSRYGQYFNVSDIPVPTGYHLEDDAPQSFNRYYRFDRTHQDVNVMVAGNKDDVANDPTNPSDPTITSGDASDNNTDNVTGKGSQSSNQHQDADTIWVTIHEMDPSDHQIRKYDVPEYISGDTGDTSNIYAADYTPEAQKNQQGKVEYYFTPYDNDTVYDSDNKSIGKNNLNNYTQANITINSDGTTTADYDNNVHNVINRDYYNGKNNHFDFYYYVKQSNSNLEPINVTYMDGSKAVGFKQIDPTSDNYYGQDITNTISYINGNTHGDTPSDNTAVPTGYKKVYPNDNYPTTFDDNNPQDIVIPVEKNKTRNLSDTYTVINNFYSGADHDMSHFVGTNSSSTHLSSVYSGELEPVSPSASTSYNGVTYSGGSENSSVDVDILGNNSATPNVIVYNYYHRTSMSASSAGKQGKEVSGTAQPFYVQYYTGSNSTIVNSGNIPASDYIIGNDNELTGSYGYKYNDVTKVTPVPEGYHLVSGQTTWHTVSDQPYQMDLYVVRDDTAKKAVNFPVTVILKDQNNNQLAKYTTNNNISDGATDKIKQSDYNPNSHDFNYDSSDVRNYPGLGSKTEYDVKNINGVVNPTQVILVYKMNTQNPKDIAPINVTYIDKDTGNKVNASNVPNTANGINVINGNYMNQNFSDITKQNGTGTSTVPSNYKLVPNQNLDDHISRNEQNVDVLVKNTQPTSTPHYLKINVVEENKDNGTAKYASDVYYAPITSDMTVDPHNFIPMSDAKYSDYGEVSTLTEYNNKVSDIKEQDKAAGKSDKQIANDINGIPKPEFNKHLSDSTLNIHHKEDPYYTGNSNSTAYYVDPVDHDQAVTTGQDRTITFIYDKGHQKNYGGSIVLKYFNQNGKQVGYTDVIHGQNGSSDNIPNSKFNRYGQRIDVTKTNNGGDVPNYSTGEPVPTGYHLVPSDQPTKYTFNNDTQYVDLYLNGKPMQNVVNIYIHKETKHDPSGDNPSDITTTTANVNTPAGDTDTFDPNNYVPTGYHVDPRHPNSESVTVKSDGTLIGPNGQPVTQNDMGSNINFYYNQNRIVYSKPYIVRYVNQNGQQVGYSDVVNDPNEINNSDVNLTKLSDGGEPVPAGYQLDQSHVDKDGNPEAMSSNDASDLTNIPYSDHDVFNYKFGNNHVVTLKVIGEKVNVPLVVHLIKLNVNGVPTNTSDNYGFQDNISDKRVGDSFYLTADQYLDKDNATNHGFDGHYLPGNSDGNNYQVAPNDIDLSKGIDVDNTARKATVEIGKNGKAYLSLDEVNNGGHVEDNQANFYYEPSKNEQPAPINVFYIDKNTGRLLRKGNIPVINGKVDGYGVTGQISDVNGKGNNTNPPSDYNVDVNPDTGNKNYPATVMHNEQNVYVPVSPQPATSLSITVHANIKNAVGSTISTASSNVDMSNPSVAASYGIGDSATFSPYSYAYLASGYNVYPTNNDHDQTLSDIQGNHHYNVYFDYQQAANQSNFNLGTINVHYVTKGANDGENIQIGKSGFYQVDQESDHGTNNQTFDLTDYLNDIPSYQNNYYHLVTSDQYSDGMNFKNNQGVIGYYGIYNKPLDSKALSTDTLPLPTSLTDFHYHTDPKSDVHTIFGDPTFATRASNTSTDPGYNEAKDTKDIYILVSPNNADAHGYIPDTNSDSTGNGNAKDNTGNNPSNNPSMINSNHSFTGNGIIPDNQGNDAGGDENHTFTR